MNLFEVSVSFFVIPYRKGFCLASTLTCLLAARGISIVGGRIVELCKCFALSNMIITNSLVSTVELGYLKTFLQSLPIITGLLLKSSRVFTIHDLMTVRRKFISCQQNRTEYICSIFCFSRT